MNKLPIIITSGEPSGIGAEIIIKAYKKIKNKIPCILMGDEKFLKKIAIKNNVSLQKIKKPKEYKNFNDKLCVLNFDYDIEPIPGKPNKRNSKKVIENIVNCTKLVLNNECSALVTAPIDKGILKEGTLFEYPGHTEFISNLCKNKTSPIMMMMSKNLKVTTITTHIPLKDVSKEINPSKIFQFIKILNSEIELKFNIIKPKILVTGLNPHAGERGKIGDEEQKIILPTIEKLKKSNINIYGPVSADTAFLKKNLDFFDVFVCMYHDQALIPIKILDFFGSINVTLGIPIIRTSPDHGTAYDIAGKNASNPDSMIFAIEQAYSIYKNQNEKIVKNK
tara:strand:- start:455 stop:1462 length:1008 start_codon:yes stop_codon:yes gene_type:complete